MINNYFIFQSLKHLKKEYQAVCCLLRRSGIDEIFLQKVIKISRNFSVVTVNYNSPPSSKGESSQNTSSDSSKENTGSSNNENSDKEPDKDKLIQLILKFSLVVFVQLLVVSVLLNSKSGAEETAVGLIITFWHKFPLTYVSHFEYFLLGSNASFLERFCLSYACKRRSTTNYC